MGLVEPALAQRYRDEGWWTDLTMSQRVRDLANDRPGDPAFITPDRRTTWREYDSLADQVARCIVSAGISPSETVAVILPDDARVHAGLVGTERAGVIAVGVGVRAGDAEVAYLLNRTKCRHLLTASEIAGRTVDRFVDDLRARGVELDTVIEFDQTAGPLIVRSASAAPEGPSEVLSARSIGPDDLFMLNSTSGTTGLPKCVTQFQNRWFYFSKLAVEAGELSADDVFLGAIPAPYGFGLWTAHFCPTYVGSPAVVLPRFSVEDLVAMIERDRVSVLCCVSTQFRMLLNSPAARSADLSSLRVMFTGGEPIPPERAAEFERRTGAVVLNFFGSNESGAFTCTRLSDPETKRLTTVGKPLPEMQMRLFDDDGRDITATGGPGQPGGRGPLTCAGYYDDAEANSKLYTPDGWLLMGDYVSIDSDGYVQVVGRKSDLIIRGGKNISAVQVEGEVETHPGVDLVAVVPVPDEVFGEKVCAVVSLRPHAELTLPQLVEHLRGRGVGNELLPEYLVILPSLPRSSGAKLAKGEIRGIALRELGLERPAGIA